MEIRQAYSTVLVTQVKSTLSFGTDDLMGILCRLCHRRRASQVIGKKCRQASALTSHFERLGQSESM